MYYLSYAYGFPEQIAYATAERITDPYTYRGVINDVIPNSTSMVSPGRVSRPKLINLETG